MRLLSFTTAAVMLTANFAAHADGLTTYDVYATFQDGSAEGTAQVGPSLFFFQVADITAMINGVNYVFDQPTIFGTRLGLFSNGVSDAAGDILDIVTGPGDSFICGEVDPCQQEGFDILSGITFKSPLSSDEVVSGDIMLAQTPEPASIALLGTGMLGIAGVVRKRLRLKREMHQQ